MSTDDAHPTLIPEFEDEPFELPAAGRPDRGFLLAVGLGAAVVTGLGFAWLQHVEPAHEPMALADWQPIPPEPGAERTLLAEDGQEESSPIERARALQAEVERLQAALDVRTAEAEALESDLAAQAQAESARAAGTQSRVSQLKGEVAQLRRQLRFAKAERDQAREELKEALVALEIERVRVATTRIAAERYQRANTDNLWAAFVNHAAIEVCDQSARGRREACRAELASTFDAQAEERFAACIESGGAQPVVEAWDRRDPLPETAMVLDRGGLFSREQWVVRWCDPTLPEAGFAQDDLLSQPAQRFAAVGSGLAR